MKDSYLVIPLQAKDIEFGIWIVVLFEEVHDVEFDETKGSQDENENFEDVRGIQLSNAMKNMNIGELRPRQVNDDEDDQVQVLSNTNLQDDTNRASISGSHNNEQDQVASTSSQPNDQASASNQVPILQGIIHWTLSLVTFQEACRLDQDLLHFVSIFHLCHPLNQRR